MLKCYNETLQKVFRLTALKKFQAALVQKLQAGKFEI